MARILSTNDLAKAALNGDRAAYFELKTSMEKVVHEAAESYGDSGDFLRSLNAAGKSQFNTALFRYGTISKYAQEHSAPCNFRSYFRGWVDAFLGVFREVAAASQDRKSESSAMR